MHAYRLRTCEPTDEPALLELFALVFGHPRSSDEWRWKFASSRMLLDLPGASDSLVALDERGLIVAHAGALILPGWFEGRSIPIVQVCDVMVHPAHRGGLGRNNLFTRLLRALLDRLAERFPTAFRYGFPGQRPYLLGERAGVYERMEIAIESEIPACRSRFNPWRTIPLAWDDWRLDRLWKHLRHRHDLSLVRNGAYLHWRYADHPSHTYRLTGLTLLGRLAGWIVSRQDGDRLLLVDALLPHVAVRAALQTLAARLGEDGGQSVARIWLPESWRHRLAGLHHETPVVTANMCWQSTIETQRARQSLYYTMGDVDIF